MWADVPKFQHFCSKTMGKGKEEMMKTHKSCIYFFWLTVAYWTSNNFQTIYQCTPVCHLIVTGSKMKDIMIRQVETDLHEGETPKEGNFLLRMWEIKDYTWKSGTHAILLSLGCPSPCVTLEPYLQGILMCSRNFHIFISFDPIAIPLYR